MRATLNVENGDVIDVRLDGDVFTIDGVTYEVNAILSA